LSLQQNSALPSVSAVIDGKAIYSDTMPVWLGVFGDNIWPFCESSSELYMGPTASSIVWQDYVLGRGGMLHHPNSKNKTRYVCCLTPEIISDLKVAAVIHSYFPTLIKNARCTKVRLDPKTVKGRIEELAKFFSLVIISARLKLGIIISRLDQIPFSLLKEVISLYPGRSAHLKRALKLISDPTVQKNIKSPLQWGLVDITKSSISWNEIPDAVGIPTLSDAKFLFLINYCKKSIAKFKQIVGLDIYDSECRELPIFGDKDSLNVCRLAIEAYYSDRQEGAGPADLQGKFGLSTSYITEVISDSHTAALMLILLFTGMRASETLFIMRGSLTIEHGYAFIKSKVVKGRFKDIPICEGWLAINITRDAYDILSFICERTGNSHLFSTPFSGYAKSDTGYRSASLNTKFSRWLTRIDVDGLFTSPVLNFSIHQCRETLVFQLAKQEVGMTFISMQLKHFHSQFNSMPNTVSANYGQYRKQLMVSIANRIAEAREGALLDVYGENANFAGGGGGAHKARIDTFFSGLGLFGSAREKYIKAMARRGVKLMPTSIGSCTKNFIDSVDDRPPPCYGDLQCDPDCPSHAITVRCAIALQARKEHAIAEAGKEVNPDYKLIWLGLADKLAGHINKLEEFVEND
jgi:hypothetical protein